MPQDNEVKQDKKQVSMSNKLARAHQGLILTEKRLVALGMSKIDSRAWVDPRRTNFRTEITAQEYASYYGVTLDSAYDALKDAARKLYQRNIRFFVKSRDGKRIDTEINVRWLTQATYCNGEGRIELFWNPQLLQHISGLRSQFMTYKLRLAKNFKSIYAWRLFELLMSFFSTKKANIGIEDFWRSMELTEKQKSNFGYIRRRILEPAIEEISQKSHFIINYRAIKKGRRIVFINFVYAIDREKLDIKEGEMKLIENEVEYVHEVLEEYPENEAETEEEEAQFVN
jgi:plasmid replication initiation protein